MPEEINKDRSQEPWRNGEVPEYSRLCKQVLADIDTLLPMLDDEARELFWRIFHTQTKISEIAVNDSFHDGICVACEMMREEMEL